MKQQKASNPLAIIGIIWVLVIFITALVKPDLPIWAYLIIGLPLIALSFLLVYGTLLAIFHHLVEWIAATSDRTAIKFKIKEFVILIIIILVVYNISKL